MRLNDRQTAKTEALVRQFEQLGAFTRTNPSYEDYKASLRRLQGGVKEEARKLPESDIKTDMLTALYLYERVLAGWPELERRPPSASGCASEREGVYHSLCQDAPGSQKDLLWMKAARHVTWARAVIDAGQQGRDERTTNALRELRAERRLDQILGRRAIEALKELEENVIVYNSLGEFEAGRSLARVSFESFAERLHRVSPEVKHILCWLPESRLKMELRNALSAYLDGGFWWARVYRPAVVNVASLRFRDTELTSSDKAYFSTDLYTVAVNWRQGREHLKRAAQTLSSLS